MKGGGFGSKRLGVRAPAVAQCLWRLSDVARGDLMSANGLVPGESHAVTLVDGVPNTPHVTAVLTLEKSGTIRVVVPYVRDAEEHATVQAWFDSDGVPPHLLAFGSNMRLELFGCRNSGYVRFGGYAATEGHIWVEDALMGVRTSEFDAPLQVREVTSYVDGLYEWARLSSVESEYDSQGEDWDRENLLMYTVQATEGLVWQQEGATASIRSTFQGAAGRGINIEDQAVIRTRFVEPRPFQDHLREQRAFVSLLSIIFGCPIAFRRHVARDDSLRLRNLGGGDMGMASVDVISRQTSAEHLRPVPEASDFHHPIIRMPSLTSSHLESWRDGVDEWERIVLPIAGIFRVPASSTFVENVAMNSAVSLEALGEKYIPFQDGEHDTYRKAMRNLDSAEKMRDSAVSKTTIGKCRTTTTDIYRALVSVGINWTSIAVSTVGLARAIADNYNGIKHPGMGAMPDSFQTAVLSDISCGVARLSILKLIGVDPAASGVDAYQLFRRADQRLSSESLIIDHDGNFVRRE